MEIELPKKIIKASRTNPKSVIIYSQPKMGKTTIAAALKDSLLIDLEQGSEFVDAVKYDVITKSKENKEIPIVTLKKLINKIRESNKEINGYTYKYIIIDTVSALEDIVLPLANKMYKDTPIGRNWMGNDVTELPNGAGYRYTRLALATTINEIEQLCDTVIILGHVKDKLVEQGGEEINERSLDLTGKMSAILCSKVDAIGYLYRDEENTVINFQPSESLLCGSRSEHLKGQKITVASSDSSGNVTIDWSKIFIDE